MGQVFAVLFVDIGPADRVGPRVVSSGADVEAVIRHSRIFVLPCRASAAVMQFPPGSARNSLAL